MTQAIMPVHGGDIYSEKVELDFSVNLNPTGMDAEAAALIEDAFSESYEQARCYPDIIQRDVRPALASLSKVGAENVYAGSGASELIMGICHMIRPQKALIIEPSFQGYAFALSSVGTCRTDRIFLSEEKGFELTEETVSIDGETDIVFIQDPWNPTGRNADEDVIISLIDRAEQCGAAVVLDESFYGISEKSMIMPERAGELIDRCSRLFVIRSFTKSFALPGIRMGYAISSPENITELMRHIPEWNLSCTSSSVMKACAKIAAESDFLSASVRYIREERVFLMDGLRRLGMKVFESDTVFLLFRYDGNKDLYSELLEKKILIRDCEMIPGLQKGFYRIAVRRRKDNEKLLAAMDEVINGN